MRLLKMIGRFAAAGLLAMLFLPLLIAFLSAIIDRGPDGTARVSAFPLALTLFDPFVWTCARNSILVATATAAGSAMIGLGLGSIVGSGRFWGRSLLGALAISPIAAGPLLIAASLVSTVEGEGRWAWLAESTARWLGLVWVGIACGAPLIALATTSGLRRIDGAWSDAALAVGASRRRAWLDIVWPNLRPGVARASAVVFTLALLEPAGPLVFGLGRTLAVQLIRAATRFDQPTRASGLALLSAAIGLVAWTLIVRWGGPSHARGDHPAMPTPVRPAVAWASRLILVAWCTATLSPLATWLAQGVRSAALASPGLVAGWLNDLEIRAWAINSAMTAGLAVVVNLAILRGWNARGSRRFGRSIRQVDWLTAVVPPLALAAWALAVPWVIMTLAEPLDGPIASGLRRLAVELSPGRSPGFLLILILAAATLPMLAEAAARTRGRQRRCRVDASRLMGETDRRAATAGQLGWLGVVPASSAFLAFAAAATSLAPALILTPFSERRTLTPAVLDLVVTPGPLDPRVFGLALVVFLLNLVALAWAKTGSIDDPVSGLETGYEIKGH